MNHFLKNTQLISPSTLADSHKNLANKPKYEVTAAVPNKLNTPDSKLNHTDTFITNQTTVSTQAIASISTESSNLSNHKLITNDMIDLASLILDSNQPWQVHNCKLLEKYCDKAGTLPFLYHYDRLPDHLKYAHPLKGHLLAQFNTPMTASQACEIIGITADNITQPWFVKLTGTVVIYHEPMQLAVRLHWSNTNAQYEHIYCNDNAQALAIAMKNWQFLGRVDTLYKQKKQRFVVYDEDAQHIETAQYIIPQSDSYQQMPADFALNLFEKLHHALSVKANIDNMADDITNKTCHKPKEEKANLQWLETIILQRVQ